LVPKEYVVVEISNSSFQHFRLVSGSGIKHPRFLVTEEGHDEDWCIPSHRSITAIRDVDHIADDMGSGRRQIN
jgi:hypothetical protein